MFFLEPKRLGAAIDGWPDVGSSPSLRQQFPAL